MHDVRRLAALVLAIHLLPPNAAAQQTTGVVEGIVTEGGSGRPLVGAQVFIAGTSNTLAPQPAIEKAAYCT